MERYNGLLERLPEDARDKVAWKNAEKLCFSAKEGGRNE
jgi:hypothetical protein